MRAGDEVAGSGTDSVPSNRHAFEWATGRPPSDRALRYLMAGGLTIMFALMLFAVGNDLFCP